MSRYVFRWHSWRFISMSWCKFWNKKQLFLFSFHFMNWSKLYNTLIASHNTWSKSIDNVLVGLDLGYSRWCCWCDLCLCCFVFGCLVGARKQSRRRDGERHRLLFVRTLQHACVTGSFRSIDHDAGIKQSRLCTDSFQLVWWRWLRQSHNRSTVQQSNLDWWWI